MRWNKGCNSDGRRNHERRGDVKGAYTHPNKEPDWLGDGRSNRTSVRYDRALYAIASDTKWDQGRRHGDERGETRRHQSETRGDRDETWETPVRHEAGTGETQRGPGGGGRTIPGPPSSPGSPASAASSVIPEPTPHRYTSFPFVQTRVSEPQAAAAVLFNYCLSGYK